VKTEKITGTIAFRFRQVLLYVYIYICMYIYIYIVTYLNEGGTDNFKFLDKIYT